MTTEDDDLEDKEEEEEKVVIISPWDASMHDKAMKYDAAFDVRTPH